MKFGKLVSILVVISLLLLAMAVTAVMVGAQGPDDTPTEEATDPAVSEATEVVTPTVEATEAVTPTVEATEAVTPTVEATEAVTPTVEATEAVTPTVEATATVTPTVQPTEVVTPTVTPTETVTPTVEPSVSLPTEGAGELGTQAVVGSWSSAYIGIQNLGVSLADVTFDLYPQESGVIADTQSFTIPVEGGVALSASDLSVSDGAYAGVVASSEPLAAAVFNINYSYKAGDTYLGFTSTSPQQTLPLIFRGHVGWTSKFHIQNTSGSLQTVTVYAYPDGASSPSDSPTYDIPANSSRTVDLMSSDFSNFGSGTGAFGYAVVEGGSGDIAVIVDSIQDKNTGVNNVSELYYQGFSAAQAGRDLIAPLVFNGHAGWNTGISTINLSSSVTTTLTFTYSINAQYGGGTQVRTEDLGPGQKSTFYMPQVSPALTRPSYGAVTVHSSSADVVATMTSSKLKSGGSLAFTGPLLNPSLATQKVAVPLVFNGYESWNSGVSVYTVGTAGTVSVKYVKANSDPTLATNYFEYSQPGVDDGQVSFYTPQVPGMYKPFIGVAYFESTGGPILALITTNTPGTTYVAAQMPAQNY